MKTSIDYRLTMLKKKLHSESFKTRHRKEDHLFTRNRLLSFVGLIVAQINRLNKSLSVEVSRFMSLISEDASVDLSKQAFSKARKGLKASAFVELNEDLIKDYYSSTSLDYFHDFLVCSIDGSDLQLPNVSALQEAFGVCKGGPHPMSMARISRLFDIRHRLIIDSQIGPYSTSEQTLAQLHLDQGLSRLGPQPVLIIYDRNYPSFYFFAYHAHLRLDYIMRLPQNFSSELKSFAQSGLEDQIIEIDLNQKGAKVGKEIASIEGFEPQNYKLKLRLAKIVLDSGEIEYLATSVLEQDRIPTEALKGFYHLRWGSETDYDQLKNPLEIENFSAKTPEGIKQDFHAATLTQNITQLLIEEAQKQIDQELQSAKKKLSYNYQVNRAVAYGLVKDQLPKLFFGQEPIEQITQRIIQKIKKRKNPIKPNRKFPHKRKTNHKFHQNKRPVL